MRLIAAVRRMDHPTACREVPGLAGRLHEAMGSSLVVVTSVHEDARNVGRLILSHFYPPRMESGSIFARKWGEVSTGPSEPLHLDYLSEANGTQQDRYDGDVAKVLQKLETPGAEVNGLVVVPDYAVYRDLREYFRHLQFKGSGRHKIPSLEEAAATLFDLRDKRIRYL